ncbi:histidinol-phosphate transaminase [Cytobacillus sp. Hz8]|uniref:histidinol-phosphate transaminase n=1 Tax=Cytobacillus sp. Hz8 TaxID=3347168 RepID=UPI0035DFE1B0
MRWKEQLLTLTPYQPGKTIGEVKRQYGLKDITKLASNENPFGCSKVVLEVLQKAAHFEKYPDGYATEFRFQLAKFLKVQPDQLIFGNGSDEIIQIISRALLDERYNTVMATPTFSQYKHNAIIDGAKSIREIPLIDGEHDLTAMLNAIDDKTNVVWLCSPNNPTGAYIPEDKLINFLNMVPKSTLVVLDEAYYEYVVAEDYYNSIELLKDYQNLIVLRTFSKIYGLASFRVGYGVSHPDVIRALEPARGPFNTNTLGQLVAANAIKDQAFVNSCRKANREGLQQYYDFCEENGLNYFPSQANFILIDFDREGNEVFQYLIERGYIVRSGNALGFPTSVRITVGSKEQNEGLIQLLKEYVSQIKAHS